MKLARAALHMWEEPPISGSQGSGTVFFSGCSLHCVYCQNQEISNGSVAKEVAVERLAQIFLEQQGRGAHNINLVTPSHFAPQVVEALSLARSQGLELPIVCNCSGYESPDALKCFEGWVDIYLTDFKYSSSERAQRYSRAPDYPQVASKALDEMYRQTGPYRENPRTGLLEKGVVVRHLLLPGGLLDSFGVMRILAGKPYARELCVSLMSQYTAMPGCENDYPELAASIDPSDYDALVDYALDLGLENSFCQEGEAASESFIPAFDFEGV
ncbi:MAG: 4Fe-4S cluster-binding domain-containing protein [Coriobacteriales bacterium]